MNCLLCLSPSVELTGNTYECGHCALVFKNPACHLSLTEDFKRYSSHQNNEEDRGYIDFLNRLVNPLTTFLPEKFKALDFGSGPGPTMSTLLTKKGGEVLNYDPIFCNDQEALKKKYDVITSTEVVEHFKRPKEDWSLLVGALDSNGVLAIMTQFLTSEIDYKSWWYKNDPTHVVFYKEKTFIYLAKCFELDVIYNDKNSVIIFKKNRG